MSFLFEGDATAPIPIPSRKNTEDEYDVMNLLSYLSVEDASIYDDYDNDTVSSEDFTERYIGDKKEYTLIIAQPYFVKYNYYEYTSRAVIDSFTREYYDVLNCTKIIALKISSNNFYVYRLSKVLRKNDTHRLKYTYYVTYKSKKEKYEDIIDDITTFLNK